MSIDSSAIIHETAIVADGAKIGAGVKIGPYSVVGAQVELGEESEIQSHAVVTGNTVLGARNRIFPFASVGAEPQDLKYSGEESRLVLGDENIVREYVTLQPGTTGGGLLTKIGNKNLFMASTHVGHDCIVGDQNILANSAALSGHVIVGNNVTIGGLCGVHQFVRLGDHSFLGGGAMVVQDVPPFCLAQGDRAHLFGLNVVGLRRHGFSTESIRALKICYRELFSKSGKLRDRVDVARNLVKRGSEVDALLSFVESSERGLTSPHATSLQGDDDSPGR
jgi:UDP-N-acetylglucosamine acyltransferase